MSSTIGPAALKRGVTRHLRIRHPQTRVRDVGVRAHGRCLFARQNHIGEDIVRFQNPFPIGDVDTDGKSGIFEEVMDYRT